MIFKICLVIISKYNTRQKLLATFFTTKSRKDEESSGLRLFILLNVRSPSSTADLNDRV